MKKMTRKERQKLELDCAREEFKAANDHVRKLNDQLSDACTWQKQANQRLRKAQSAMNG